MGKLTIDGHFQQLCWFTRGQLWDKLMKIAHLQMILDDLLINMVIFKSYVSLAEDHLAVCYGMDGPFAFFCFVCKMVAFQNYFRYQITSGQMVDIWQILSRFLDIIIRLIIRLLDYQRVDGGYCFFHTDASSGCIWLLFQGLTNV